MNAVGKIFVVLIFVMSIMFMSFVMATYMAHTNWRKQAQALTEDLQAARDENAKLSDQKAAAEADKAAAELNRQEQVDQLTAEIALLKEENLNLSTTNKDLRSTENDRIAAITVSAEEQKNLRGDWEDNLQALADARAERDRMFKEMQHATDALHNTQLEYEALEARLQITTDQLADAMTVLGLHDLQRTPSLYSMVPPPVEGVVLGVRPTGLIEIAIGSDDGIRPGHRLQVYRETANQSVYLGKVEVTTVAPDKAVCKILPEFRKGTIEEGDHVASKLD